MNDGFNFDDIIEKLKAMSNPDAIRGMARFGITPENTFGVSIPNLRKIAKETKKNHALAQQLWESGFRETMILASMLDEPEMVTRKQMEQWVLDFDYWEICDQCCMNLFEKTGFAYEKAVEWSNRNEEFVKRAGFVLMARLAVSDKQAEDSRFGQFFPIMLREANDERNFVKKAVNWALRQIGKRNLALNGEAIKTAMEMHKIGSKSAKWIASDAIRELSGEAVQERLRKT
ncbi:MAG TPA: DNA alkylation repair protein [Methanosarcinaceae archaeon]|nr:DNA alkylation repair protein [Methanosarcinaceae archaeon]